MSNIRQIPLRFIRQDARTQARAGMNHDVVEAYATKMVDGAKFPPVVLFQDKDHYWLGDGFHRVAAAEKAGKKNINAEIREGAFRDAWLHSIGANDNHGARLTNADKRHAVTMLLKDDLCSTYPDRRLAVLANVSQPFVSKMRTELLITVITPEPENVSSDDTQAGQKLEPEQDGEDDFELTVPPAPAPPTPAPPSAPNRVLDAIEKLLDEPEPVKASPLAPDESRVLVPLEDRARLAQLERLVVEKESELAELHDQMDATQELIGGIEADQEQIASLIRVVDAGGNLNAMMAENKRLMEDARICRARLAGAMNTINENKGWVKFWKDRHDGLIKKVQKAVEALGKEPGTIEDLAGFAHTVRKALAAATKPNPKAKACEEAMTAITTEEEDYIATFGEEPQ